jgi:predicted site-specific integrase-resolvase
MGSLYLTEQDLATRWEISERTLQKWRVRGAGPVFRKIGSNVRYDERDVEAYEDRQARTSTSDTGPAK